MGSMNFPGLVSPRNEYYSCVKFESQLPGSPGVVPRLRLRHFLRLDSQNPCQEHPVNGQSLHLHDDRWLWKTCESSVGAAQRIMKFSLAALSVFGENPASSWQAQHRSYHPCGRRDANTKIKWRGRSRVIPATE